MKLKSVLLVFTGIVIGGLLFASPKSLRNRKELSKKAKKYKKAFKESAFKYKQKLASHKDAV